MMFIRDKYYKARFHSQKIDLKTVVEAEQWLREQEEAASKMPGFIKRQERFLKNQGEDLFRAQDKGKRLNPSFESLNNEKGYSPAKALISKIMPCSRDVDGELKEQFQTDGFDMRLWELYLYCYFSEEGIRLGQDCPAPNCCICKGKDEIGVEAVTLGSSQREKKMGTGKTHRDMEGKPFVLAVANAHGEKPMVWIMASLMKYLYGHDCDIPYHITNGKQMDAGYFFQKGTEHISAVLYSANGTMETFNRMGRQCGYGDPDIRMFCYALAYDGKSDTVMPKIIRYEVTEDRSEMWSEGIVVFHNPNAVCPLPFDFFEFAVQGWFDDGVLKFTTDHLVMFSSLTTVVG